MYKLVRFEGNQYGIYHKKNVKLDLHSDKVIVRCWNGRFQGKIIMENDDKEILMSLKGDITNEKRVTVVSLERLDPYYANCTSRMCVRNLFDAERAMKDEVDFESSFKFLDGNTFLDNYSLNDNYEIIESIEGTYRCKETPDVKNQLELNVNSHSMPSSNGNQADAISFDDASFNNGNQGSSMKLNILENIHFIPEICEGTGLTENDISSQKLTANCTEPTMSLCDQWFTILDVPSVSHQLPYTVIYDCPQEENFMALGNCNSSILENIDRIDTIGVPELEQSRNIQKQLKKHSCLFCTKMVTNLPRHLKRMHKDEQRVKDAITESAIFARELRKSGKKCRYHNAFEQLRKDGDRKHNLAVETADAISVQKPHKPDTTNLVTCPTCNGYYSRKSLKTHVQRYCSVAGASQKNIMGFARVAAMKIHPLASRELIENYFPYLTKEKQRNVIVTDSTSILFANVLVAKYHKSTGEKHTHIMAQLRLLADIFNLSKEIDSSVKEISDLFDPLRYDVVKEAIKKRAGFDQGNDGSFRVPTMAMHACILFGKISEILKCEAIKNSNEALEKRIDKFVYLLDKLRNADITKVAQENRTTNQRAKLEQLPTTKEVAHLMNMIQKEFDDALQDAERSFNLATYTRLAKSILVYIMVFNRKRPGDCHKTLTVEYKNLSKVTDEHLEKLSDHDKETANTLGRFVAQGKLNKKASNLIPLKLTKALDFILANRVKVNIEDNHKYLFANPRSKRLPYFRGDQALKLICSKYNIDYNRIHANKLRKHLATATSTLPQNIQTVISDFMGHTMGIHKEIYQQRQVHTDIITMGKILKQANGLEDEETEKIVTPITDANAVFKKLDTSNNSWCDDDDDDEDDLLSTNFECSFQEPFDDNYEPSSTNPLVNQSFHESTTTTTTEEGQEDNTTYLETYDRQQTQVLNTIIETEENRMDHTYSPENTKDDLSSDTTESPPRKRMRPFKTYVGTRKTWKTPERYEVRRLFHEYITALEPPSLADIRTILSGQPHSIERRADRVQAWVVAEIERKKKWKKGKITQRWSTPQKQKLLQHFKFYFNEFRRTKIKQYPSLAELQAAAMKVKEFQDKSHEKLRSKIQHIYKLMEEEK